MKLRTFKFLLILFAFSYISVHAQNGWEIQSSGTTNDLWSVTFLNANTGFCVGEAGTIKKTTNGGTTWVTQTSGTSDTLYCIQFANDTGYVSGTNGTIRKTVNGGTTWTPVSSGTTKTIKSFHFLNGNLGYTAAYSGEIRKTTNGGTSWVLQSSGTTENLWGIHFAHRNLGWAVGFHGTVKRTTNGGTNWTTQSNGFSGTEQLTSINFLNASTGITTVGLPPSIDFFTTTNGGDQWVAVNGGSVHSERCIDFIDNNTWMIVGDEGDVFRTTNGGNTWSFYSTGLLNWLYSTSFVSPTEGWAVGTNGIILHTTSGGVTGITTIGNTIPGEYALHNNYPNPFNPSTNIKFDLPRNTDVKLVIYDLSGAEVQTAVNSQLQAGSYELQFNGKNLSSGVYFYRLITNEFTETKKMILVK